MANNYLHSTYDVSKIFLGNNRYSSFTYTNPTGAIVTLTAGQLMGRVSATQKVLPLASAAVDGSQYPIGIVNEDRDVQIGETVTIALCVAGNVAREKVICNGADTLATPISLRSIEDRIGSDTVGIKLVATTELTGYDNV